MSLFKQIDKNFCIFCQFVTSPDTISPLNLTDLNIGEVHTVKGGEREQRLFALFLNYQRATNGITSTILTPGGGECRDTQEKAFLKVPLAVYWKCLVK